jgi:hypothetical protein
VIGAFIAGTLVLVAYLLHPSEATQSPAAGRFLASRWARGVLTGSDGREFLDDARAFPDWLWSLRSIPVLVGVSIGNAFFWNDKGGVALWIAVNGSVLVGLIVGGIVGWLMFTPSDQKRLNINSWCLFFVLIGFFRHSFSLWSLGALDAYVDNFDNWPTWQKSVPLLGIAFVLGGAFALFGEQPWHKLWRTKPWPATIAASIVAVAGLFFVIRFDIPTLIGLPLVLIAHSGIMLAFPAGAHSVQRGAAITNSRSADDYPVVTWQQFLVYKNRGSPRERKINTQWAWGGGLSSAIVLAGAWYLFINRSSYAPLAIIVGLFALSFVLASAIQGFGFGLTALRYLFWWSWRGVDWDGTVRREGKAYVAPSPDGTELLFNIHTADKPALPGHSERFPYRELAHFTEMSQKEWEGPIEHEFEFMDTILILAYRHGQGAAVVAQLGVTTHAEVFDFLEALTNAFVKEQAALLRRFELENEAKETRPEADGSASVRDRPAV